MVCENCLIPILLISKLIGIQMKGAFANSSSTAYSSSSGNPQAPVFLSLPGQIPGFIAPVIPIMPPSGISPFLPSFNPVPVQNVYYSPNFQPSYGPGYPFMGGGSVYPEPSPSYLGHSSQIQPQYPYPIPAATPMSQYAPAGLSSPGTYLPSIYSRSPYPYDTRASSLPFEDEASSSSSEESTPSPTPTPSTIPPSPTPNLPRAADNSGNSMTSALVDLLNETTRGDGNESSDQDSDEESRTMSKLFDFVKAGSDIATLKKFQENRMGSILNNANQPSGQGVGMMEGIMTNVGKYVDGVLKGALKGMS